jgi:hypothetical protein
MKISILAESLILHVFVVDNKVVSLCGAENVKDLTCFSHFLAFPRRNAAKKQIQTPS